MCLFSANAGAVVEGHQSSSTKEEQQVDGKGLADVIEASAGTEMMRAPVKGSAFTSHVKRSRKTAF